MFGSRVSRVLIDISSVCSGVGSAFVHDWPSVWFVGACVIQVVFVCGPYVSLGLVPVWRVICVDRAIRV